MLDQSVKLALDAIDLALDAVDLTLDQVDFTFNLLVRLVDESAHIFLHNAFPLCVLIDSRLQLCALATDLVSVELRLALNNLGQPANGAFPFVAHLVGYLKLIHDKHIDLAASNGIFVWQDGSESSQELELRPRSIDGSILDDFVEAIAHDGDQHIKHRQL